MASSPAHAPLPVPMAAHAAPSTQLSEAESSAPPSSPALKRPRELDDDPIEKGEPKQPRIEAAETPHVIATREGEVSSAGVVADGGGSLGGLSGVDNVEGVGNSENCSSRNAMMPNSAHATDSGDGANAETEDVERDRVSLKEIADAEIAPSDSTPPVAAPEGVVESGGHASGNPQPGEESVPNVAVMEQPLSVPVSIEEAAGLVQQTSSADAPGNASILPATVVGSDLKPGRGEGTSGAPPLVTAESESVVPDVSIPGTLPVPVEQQEQSSVVVDTAASVSSNSLVPSEDKLLPTEALPIPEAEAPAEATVTVVPGEAGNASAPSDTNAVSSAPAPAPARIGAIGLGLRSAPVGQAAAETAREPEPAPKPKKSVSWASDNQLVDVRFIDTRMDLIKSWDPESEITLPFAPATLAHLRAQAEALERGGGDVRTGAGAGPPGVGRGGVIIRSAPQVNEFELARRREHEMELERARQVRQELQERLDKMKADRVWQQPMTIILPSECRVASGGEGVDGGLDNAASLDDSEDRLRLEFYVPWLGDDVDPRTAQHPDSPGSPISSDDLETEVPVVAIPLNESAADNPVAIDAHEVGIQTDEKGLRNNFQPSPPRRFMDYNNSSSNVSVGNVAGNHHHGSGGAGVRGSNANGKRTSPSLPVASPPQALSVAALRAVGSALRSNMSKLSPTPANMGSGPPPMPGPPSLPTPASMPGSSSSQIAPVALQQLLSQFQSGAVPLPPPPFLRPMSGMPQPPPRPPPGMHPMPPPPPGMMGMPIMPPHMPLPPHMIESIQQQQQQHRNNLPSPQGQTLQPPQQAPRSGRKSNTPCRYFNSKQGCRDGNNCNFQHIPDRGR